MGGSHIEDDAKFTGKRSILHSCSWLRHRSNFIRGNPTCGNFVSGNY